MYVFVQLRFDWDEKQQGLILGSFFWLFWTTQVPGGLLAQRYGTKLVFGLTNGIPCLLSFFIPLFARMDYRALVFLRALQGFIAVSTFSQTDLFLFCRYFSHFRTKEEMTQTAICWLKIRDYHGIK
jgi:MFS family permease